ncbi:Protein of unknown function DUF1690 [Ceraceosorus bombacis]|uniref:Uncharacterized protein n=1 Tax=Ceraceosorus bombacis TaxID=401625 RepID=A0A0P1B7Z5_9BASI|nr:Protein of unknown function DUF1690 [Ceraceosorus bombacis]
MGASSSKSSRSPDLSASTASLNALDEKVASSKPGSVALPASPSPISAARQQHLDASIQHKISSELAALKKSEASVRSEIEAALERESGTQEKRDARTKDSITLKQELEEIRTKIDRHRIRREKVDQDKSVQQARNKVLQCLKEHQSTSLECADEASAFKRAVAKAEKEFIASLSA